MADRDHGLASRTVRGMAWAYGSYVGGRLLVLLTTAILARLLGPSEFGLVAFALVVTAFLDTVSDLGVSQALIIVKDDEVERKANTAWTLAVILGAALTLVCVGLGPVAAAFFDQAELSVMLPVLGLNFLIRALGVTHFSLAQREIDFRTRTIAEVTDVIIRGATGVGLALAGAGAYSLVGGYLAGSLALTASLWLLVPFRPKPQIRRDDLGGLVRFGGGLTALDVISAIVAQVDYVAVGRVLGEAKLGLYTLGFRLPELLIVNLSYVAGMVLFPAFAGVERHALADAFLTSLRYILVVCVPAAVFLGVLAEPIVLVLFGDQWRDSIEVMQVLTLYAFGLTLGIPAGTAYKSIGRVDILVKLAIPRALLVVGSIVVFVDQGLVAVATCQLVANGIFELFAIALAGRLLSTGPRRIWRAAWPPLLAGAAMAGVTVLVVLALSDPYAALACAAPLGVAAYLGTLWLAAPDAVRRLWRMAFPQRAPASLRLAAEEELLDEGRGPAAARLKAGVPPEATALEPDADSEPER